jgi:hypothetical protein
MTGKKKQSPNEIMYSWTMPLIRMTPKLATTLFLRPKRVYRSLKM